MCRLSEVAKLALSISEHMYILHSSGTVKFPGYLSYESTDHYSKIEDTLKGKY